MYLYKFNQTEFLPEEDWTKANLDEWGYIFYPSQCVDGSLQDGEMCDLQILLHGAGGNGINYADPLGGWSFAALL